MKHFIPNGNITSNGEMIRRAGVVIPSKSVPWERRQRVPSHIQARLDEEARRDGIREALTPFRAAVVNRGAIACRKVAGNKIQIIGHGKTVDNFEQAKAFAHSIGRGTVVMGAIRAKV